MNGGREHRPVPGLLRFRTGIIGAGLILGLFAACGCGGSEEIVLGHSHVVPSRILGQPRGVNVYLPEHYEETGATYPVLIKLFGTDPDYFAGLVGQIGTLTSFGNIPPLIVVGVEQHGHDEVLPRAVAPNEVPIRAEEFFPFLRDELLPWVDEHYRTNGFRILLGTFDCGLFGVWVWLTSPQTFDAVLVTEPGWGREYECVAEWFSAREAAVSGSESFLHITEIEASGRREDPFRALLQSQLEAPGRGDLNWERIRLERESYEPHRNYTSCREGLLALFRGYRFTEAMVTGGAEEMDAWYDELSARVGYALPVPGMALLRVADVLAESGRYTEAVEILLRLERQAPWSLDAVYRLADAYQALGDRPRALNRLRQGLDMGLPPRFRVRLEALERSAASALEYELRSRGRESARRLFERIVTGRRKDLIFVEEEMNAAGYRLLRSDRADNAIVLFEMNTDQFPDSADTWDSLGEALLAAGERERAIAAYRRCLELEPAASSARETLRRLGIRP